MASPLRSMFVRIFAHNFSTINCSVLSLRSVPRNRLTGLMTVCRNVHSRRVSGLYRVGRYIGAGVCLVGGASVFSYYRNTSVMTSSVSAASSGIPDRTVKPTRMVFWYFKQIKITICLTV